MHINLSIRPILRVLTIAAAVATSLCASAKQPSTPPFDIDRIKAETTDPASPRYYPTLVKRFLEPDTSMTRDDYHYFYYGTMFAEDYNPYRANPFDKEVKALENVYLKREHLTSSERRQIEALAKKCLQDNPLELRQLMYLVYVYESSKKYNLAKIWKSKLNNLLLTIAQSGTGADAEHARIVVYPRHEFDFFNLSGLSVTAQEFVEPYYEKVTVTTGKKNAKESEHYFNLRYLLDQYYAKHPSEAGGGSDDGNTEEVSDPTENAQ